VPADPALRGESQEVIVQHNAAAARRHSRRQAKEIPDPAGRIPVARPALP